MSFRVVFPSTPPVVEDIFFRVRLPRLLKAILRFQYMVLLYFVVVIGRNAAERTAIAFIAYI